MLNSLSGATIAQVSIKPSSSGTHYLWVSNSTASTYNVETTVIETSLFSPWWYVGGTNQAFVTIRSNTATSQPGVTVRLYSNSGAICGVAGVALAGNANTYIRVNDFTSCVAAGYGSAMITFFGPPGSVSANTTVIDAVQGVSFDEPFTPRMHWTITER